MAVFNAIDDGWSMIGTHMPTSQKVYAVRNDIARWIETQPPHMWKFYDVDNMLNCYLLSEELLSWMILKWR
jgi:hypothetical protein